MRSHAILAAALVAGASIVAVTPLAAQQVPDRSLVLSAGGLGIGMSSPDAPMVALSLAQTLPSRLFAIEGTVGYARMRDDLGVAEVQGQLQWPARLVRPYIGVGVGMIHYLENVRGRPSTEASLSYGGGLRAAVTDAWGFRIDVRGRGWDGHDSIEGMFGISRRF